MRTSRSRKRTADEPGRQIDVGLLRVADGIDDSARRSHRIELVQRHRAEWMPTGLGIGLAVRVERPGPLRLDTGRDRLPRYDDFGVGRCRFRPTAADFHRRDRRERGGRRDFDGHGQRLRKLKSGQRSFELTGHDGFSGATGTVPSFAGSFAGRHDPGREWPNRRRTSGGGGCAADVGQVHHHLPRPWPPRGDGRDPCVGVFAFEQGNIRNQGRNIAFGERADEFDEIRLPGVSTRTADDRK